VIGTPERCGREPGLVVWSLNVLFQVGIVSDDRCVCGLTDHAGIILDILLGELVGQRGASSHDASYSSIHFPEAF
jgi:hypothetical protein